MRSLRLAVEDNVDGELDFAGGNLHRRGMSAPLVDRNLKLLF